jgi:hypothetical protein
MRTKILILALIVVLGCGPSSEPPPPGKDGKPAPKPDPYVEVSATPPKLGQVAYRPTFTLASGKKASAGTAFVVKAKSGEKYLVTAAHLFDPPEWKTVKSVSLATMSGVPVGQSEGEAKYIGVGTDFKASPLVTEKDLVIWMLAGGDKAEPLRLAERVPNTNRVWVVGAEVGRPGQKTFECRPAPSRPDGTTDFTQTQRFQLRAFSGGPIVNNKGEVVASLIGGGGNRIVGTSVENIRKRLAEAKIEVE